MMKKVTILAVLFFATQMSFGQIVNIPDPNFKSALLSGECVDLDGDGILTDNIDTNNDGEIQVSEAEAVVGLNLEYNLINSLEGINSFTALVSLDCQHNSIATLHLSGLTNLVYLYFNYNNINDLELTNLPKLKMFDITYIGEANISLHDLPEVDYIYLYTTEILSLSVSNLPKLNELFVKNNINLSSIEISNLDSLSLLVIEENINLSSLSIVNLASIEDITIVNGSIITDLTLTNLPNLEYLYFEYHGSNNLTIQDFPSLINLVCYTYSSIGLTLNNLPLLSTLATEGGVNQLNFNGTPNLLNIDCTHSNLQSLDLSQLPLLSYLDCSFNILTSLDFSHNPNIHSLYAWGNDLSFINFNNGTHTIEQVEVDFYDLDYICCDTFFDEYNFFNQLVSDYPSCTIYTNCSGNLLEFGLVEGSFILDSDNNGCDGNDGNIPYSSVNISGDLMATFFSNSNGSFNAYAPAGNYTLTPIAPPYFSVSPSSIDISIQDNETTTQDFCFTPILIYHDVEISIIPVNPAVPGFDADYKIVLQNLGTQVESGTINFNYNESLLDYISASPNPNNIAAGQLTWEYSNLQPFEKKYYDVTLNCNTPTDDPVLNNGDILYLSSTAFNQNDDADLYNNTFELDQTVVGSYDPNDKTCLEGNRLKPEIAGKYVHYLIRFENTGTFPAQKIVVKDYINTAMFDISTLQIVDASHAVSTSIKDVNLVEFTFDDIQLGFEDDENDGYVAFKIKTLPTLVIGDSIANSAEIYFDFNLPIYTNNAVSEIVDPTATNDILEGIFFDIAPNPTKELLTIQCELPIQRFELLNTLGAIVLSKNNTDNQLDVHQLAEGIYVLKCYTKQGVLCKKVMKL